MAKSATNATVMREMQVRACAMSAGKLARRKEASRSASRPNDSQPLSLGAIRAPGRLYTLSGFCLRAQDLLDGIINAQ
jgi:hypothetical protein